MTSDRELLELAAKAAGYTHYQDRVNSGWNPLRDDGDALRLAVKIELEVWQAGQRACTNHKVLGPRIREPHNDDPYAATRRAIVRAAAEIGRAMP